MRQPFLNGYSPAAPIAARDALRVLERINRGSFDAEIDRLLDELRVRFIAYNAAIEFLRPPEVAPDLLQRLRGSDRLRLVFEGDGWHVFERARRSRPR